MLPRALRASAVPRWSHRDPVEGGNPFPAADPRHAGWDTATVEARLALERLDARLETTTAVTLDPAIYREQLLALAVARFGTWVRRGLAVVSSDDDLRDHQRWVADYVAHWLRYVAETCPRVDTGDELRARLEAEAARRLEQARESRSSVRSPS